MGFGGGQLHLGTYDVISTWVVLLKEGGKKEVRPSLRKQVSWKKSLWAIPYSPFPDVQRLSCVIWSLHHDALPITWLKETDWNLWKYKPEEDLHFLYWSFFFWLQLCKTNSYELLKLEEYYRFPKYKVVHIRKHHPAWFSNKKTRKSQERVCN